MEANFSQPPQFEQKESYFKKFIPLIIIFAAIVLLTIIRQYMTEFSFMHFMTDFMGFFFLIFGAFKIYNLHGFVQAYQGYDLVAQKSIHYAYAYPFIEVALGIAYLLKWNLPLINLITVIIMTISALGVANELRKGKTVVCACLGAVFKIPMTYVTLLEDVLMGGMALIMLFWK